MSATQRKRFYKSARASPTENGIALDGRPVRTPIEAALDSFRPARLPTPLRRSGRRRATRSILPQ